MSAPRPPNILILYTDQQRWDALGVNGNPDIQTPNLDQLARAGLNFDHYFVQHPLCMPSRVSFLAGQYPSTLRITHMGVPVPEDLMTLPHLLRPHGYHTANIGKLHFLPHANRDHRWPHPAYGFDHLEVSDEPGVYEDAYRAWVRRQAPEQLDRLSVGLPPATYTWYTTLGLNDLVRHPRSEPRFDLDGPIAFPGDDGYTHSAFVGEQTLAFLRRQRPDQPFLCIAGFYSPHSPWVVPQRYLNQYDPAMFNLPAYPVELEPFRIKRNCTEPQLRRARHGYYAMVTEVDDYAGRILAELDRLALSDDTIVLFLSDHGEWLGDHLKYTKGYPGDDLVSRVPLIVRWPGHIHAPGRTISALVEAVDVLPTVLDCAGIQTPPDRQGQSFARAFTDPAYPGRDSALMEHAGWKNLRTRHHRYLIHADGREALWDLQTDPGEYRDQAANSAYRETLVEHRRRLLQRLVDQERPLVRAWPY
jgi:arylsulfatase A-like enzyme